MSIEQNIKIEIEKIFQREIDRNTFSNEELEKFGINQLEPLDKDEIALAEEMEREEIWLKKLFYDSIIAALNGDSVTHNKLDQEIIEYCEISEEILLLSNYKILLDKYI